MLNVKLDISNLTDIPVSRQKWVGWPEGISDDLTLAQIEIPRHHELFLSVLPRSSGRDVRMLLNFLKSLWNNLGTSGKRLDII